MTSNDEVMPNIAAISAIATKQFFSTASKPTADQTTKGGEARDMAAQVSQFGQMMKLFLQNQ